MRDEPAKTIAIVKPVINAVEHEAGGNTCRCCCTEVDIGTQHRRMKPEQIDREEALEHERQSEACQPSAPNTG